MRPNTKTIQRIISGGQTGADQAGLDVAIKHGIPNGRAIPKGRLTENGILPEKYQLEEMSTKSYPKRTDKNVVASDGTVIFTHGKLTGGSLLTRKKAIQHDKPVIHLELDKLNEDSFDNKTENNNHSKRIEMRPTFIIAYNPKKWDETLIQELIDQLNDGKEFVERWKFGSHKMCKVGDRVFLSRTGAIKPGLIGSGYIASPPYQEPNFEQPDKLSWYVDIRFDYLAPTPDTVAISHDRLSKLLGISKNSFTPQQSGVSFKGDPKLLEVIWHSHTKVESFKFAEEIVDDAETQMFSEGVKISITVNKYERDPKARRACLDIHGYSCKVCTFDFETVYGELGKEYIHVHHLIPLKEIGEKYIVAPEKDLIPVCPNCHAMLHKLDDPSDIDGLIAIMR